LTDINSTTENQDIEFMKRALKLAEKGRGYVSPNPMVGAVIVKDGKIVGEGYHQRYGEAHAEVNALEQAGDQAAGATIYVNLEPCAHQGKTGPCVEKIFKAGIARVVVGMTDPNPLVNGKGINYLRSKGVSVTEHVLEDKCRELNQGYIKFIQTGIPLLTVKIAQTIDGRIATSTGHSKWITGQESRVMSHRLRANHDGILVGVGTILADDPELTVRYTKGVSPLRIVLDSQLRMPLDAKILSQELATGTVILTTELASKEKIARIEEKGAKVMVLESDDRGWIPQDVLWKSVASLGLTSVLIEGGSVVQTECFKGGNVDRLVIFIAPKILGSGIDAIGDLGIRNINAALEVKEVTIKRLPGGDFMLSGRLNNNN